MSSSKSPLRRLSDIISDAVDKIESKCANAGLSFPPLDEPYNLARPSEALLVDPDVLENSMLIIAATNQLAATVRTPGVTLLDFALGASGSMHQFHFSSSLQALLRGNVPEILREGGSKGVHAKDIGAKSGMDPDRVSRLLRLFATHHIFREVEPDVWAHNRLSSLLDTMKPVSELFAHPEKKHLGTPGLVALLDHGTDDMMLKSGSSLAEVLTNPKSAHSDDPTLCAWNHANNIKQVFWEWFSAPENEKMGSRFNIAMDGMNKVDDSRAMLTGFPWDSIPTTSKVVDVGGGIGSASLNVAKHFPNFKFVIQDSPSLKKQSEMYWEENIPGSQKTGRVTFQGHDFFTPQPVKDADVFMMRMIIHDWPNTHSINILKHLRAAAQPGKTKLLLIDQIAPYAGPDTTDAKKIPGASSRPVPDPLLANLGKANALIYLLDIQMLTFHQGQERTIGNHIYVTSEAGWEITHVYSPAGSVFRHMVAVAV